ncbi:MAG: polysaccharide lyase 8 family protein [Opitutaceae bacterium]|nr:polysaccharide lyase 8 family protein [Opitutaceae bacterium]
MVCLAVLLCAAAARADEFDTLRLKWADMLTGGSSYNPADPIIASAITSVTNTANGNWTSLNKSTTRTHLWSDAARTNVSADLNTNYSRLRSMALAYSTTGSALEGNPTLRDDIIGGLDWMYANRYNENVRIYDNWWHFEIGSPTALVDIVTLLYRELTPSQLSNTMRTVEKFTPSATTPAAGGSTGTFTGANRMSKIVVVTIRGIIVKDDSKLRAARDAFSNLFLYVTSGDGFYTDGSFIQHNRHPYTGSYGAVLMADLSNILTLLNGPNAMDAGGSTWRVTDPRLANVYRWVYEAYEPLIYRGGMMAMTQGRAISRSGTSEHGTGHGIMQSILRISQFAPAADRECMRAMLRGWAENDTSRSFVGTAPLSLKLDAQQLMADPDVTPRGELRGNFIFGSMDRVVHLGPGFGLGLSLSSTRIYTYESINTENLHGWHTGDGMMYLYHADLAHFSDSFWPTVDPRRLPGTTVDTTQTRANGSGQSTAPSPNWVGGASLGRHGVTGMQLRGWNSTLRANKSWFMFDDLIVCLGGGISSTDNRPIETIVENRLLSSNGNNTFTVDGTARPGAPGWAETMSEIRWAYLAGRVAGADIGYYFPVAASVNGLRESRTGAWSDINAGGSTTAITRNYLTLWFNHGANPTNSAYAYALLPGRSVAEVAAFAASPRIAVLENSASAHAVRETSLGIVAVNFWNDTRYSVGGITSDRKAAVLVQDSNGTVDVALSDPTQANTGSIVLEIAATARSIVSLDPGVSVAQLAPTIRLVIDVAGARGRTFRARLSGGDAKPPASLGNLSTRGHLATRDDILIAGFVVRGSGTKRLLVRAVGPALTGFGVPDALANPRLAIVSDAGTSVAENDDWGTASTAAELAATFPAVGAFGLPDGSRDAALLMALPPGAYSAMVRNAATAGSGVVLVEVYDAEPSAEARLINLSSRVFSGSGTQTAIVGFALSGEAPRQVLVRAAGPALAVFNVAGALVDPQLWLTGRDGATMVQNDNWGSSPLVADIGGASTAVGAFAFPSGSRDSAVLLWLNPGTYTALVTETGNRTGNTLVEVYAVP